MQKILRLTAILLLMGARPAFAQEGGLLDINSGLMVWTILIFLIVLGVLYKAAFPHILGAVEAREQQIRDLLAAAAQDRQAAQEALDEQTKLLDETRARIQELVAEGRASGERVRDEIVTDARRQAEEIVGRARRDIRQEMERALQELRADAVDVALAAASKLIERNLDDADNRRLVRNYLSEIESGSAGRVPAGV